MLFHKIIICTILVHVTTFYSRADAFKYSFVPSTILEWNKLERKIRQSSTLLTFRNSLLKIGRHAPKLVYNIHNANSLKLLTRLRLGLSCLNEHEFNHNFKACVNPLCACSLKVESIPFLSALSIFHRYLKNPLYKLHQQNSSILRSSIKFIIKSKRCSQVSSRTLGRRPESLTQ